ncbi:MAG: MCE family protein, partial [Acidimicrobiales bacterium]
MSPKILVRMVLLAAILVTGLWYITFEALQIHVGSGPYAVDLHMPAGGGLYQGGYVSFRGVDVGRVTSLQVRTDGVVAKLAINRGTRIPANTDVRVRDLSAVGEQYVDFTPRTDSGPYLHGGSVVNVPPANLPLTVGNILADGSSFANSISSPALNSLLATLTDALQGTGPSLRTLLSSGQTLTSNLESVQPQTSALIDSGQGLLQTGINTNGDIYGASTSLAQLTAQLKASDGDLRALMANGTPAAQTLGQTLQADQAAVQGVLQNSAVDTAATEADRPAFQALLASLPPAIRALTSIAGPDALRFQVVFNDKWPLCTYAPFIQAPTYT